MKKFGCIMVMLSLVTVSATADVHGRSNKQSISYRAQEKFPMDFSTATNAFWSQDGELSEVSFEQNKVPMKAFYDWNGDLVGTTQKIDYNDLPPVARKNIEKQYKEYTVDGVIVYNDNDQNLNNLYPLLPEESDVNYFVSLNKAGSPTGVILKVNPDGDVSFFEDRR
ncbi:MAG TPA: hypothetical protein VFV68_16610 [Agriterribacter sp.]|nr:hypothetical protein [Agriterribacter sp.]